MRLSIEGVSQLADDGLQRPFGKVHRRTAERWRFKMFDWPEMLHHAEDWANGFWAGAASASFVGIVAAAVALIGHAI